MGSDRRGVLLTGATGFVGRELLWRIARDADHPVACIVRARSQADADARLAAVTGPLTPEQRARVRAIPGDLGSERIGLDANTWDRLAATSERVLHCGASVDWAMPLATARHTNVEGTRRMLELGAEAHRRGTLQRFDYVSTTTVCGRRPGLIREDSLDGSAGFFNYYEQSKFEAEGLVRASGLPFRVFRMSMVVGESRTGYTSAFNVMYWPLKQLARGMAFVVPANRHGWLDMVPVDYVCDALQIISRDRTARATTFHLAAGPEGAATVGELLDLGCRRFGARTDLRAAGVYQILLRPLLNILVWGKRREIMRKGRVYMPYFSYRAQFDTTETRAVVAPQGLRLPTVREYFETLIDYAVATDWGKRKSPAVAGGAAGHPK